MNHHVLANEIAETPGASEWRVMRVLAGYRWIVSVIMLAAIFAGVAERALGVVRPEAFLFVTLATAALAMAATVTLEMRRPSLGAQAVFQILADFISVGFWMWATGGVESGLGILLVFPMVAAALLLSRRMVLLEAAVASIGLLVMEALRTFTEPDAQALTQAGMLGLLLFTVGLVAHALAARARRSEALARRVGGDLVSLSRLNETIVARIRAGVLAVTPDQRVQLTNPAARQLLGLDADIRGQALDTAVPSLSAALQRWRDDPHVELEPLDMPHGRTAAMQFVPLGWGNNPAVLIMLEDAGALAAQAQQMKLAALGRLSASIAHEIRNPLGAIANAAQLLEESADLADDDRRLNDIIYRNADRIEAIVSDVLSLSRPGQRAPRNIALAETLAIWHEQFAQSTGPHATTLDLSRVEPALTVEADASHLRHIVTNVWHNSATHAAHDDTPVRLSVAARRMDTDIVLELRDDGPGIDASVAEHVFEPFFTTHASGTGLGLFLAREMARANGGQLALETGTPGACFRLRLPAVQPDHVPASQSAMDAAAGHATLMP